MVDPPARPVGGPAGGLWSPPIGGLRVRIPSATPNGLERAFFLVKAGNIGTIEGFENLNSSKLNLLEKLQLEDAVFVQGSN